MPNKGPVFLCLLGNASESTNCPHMHMSSKPYEKPVTASSWEGLVQGLTLWVRALCLLACLIIWKIILCPQYRFPGSQNTIRFLWPRALCSVDLPLCTYTHACTFTVAEGRSPWSSVFLPISPSPLPQTPGVGVLDQERKKIQPLWKEAEML